MIGLDGPRLEAASGQARHLVVFLHGYGANGDDLIGIGHQWSAALPDAAFVSPHAPEPCQGMMMNRQWFELTFRDPGERWRGVQHAHPILNTFLDQELARYQLPADKLALVGFSQGAMMALHTGLRRHVAPAALVGYSGLLVTPPDQEPIAMQPEITARPPVLLVHGDQDSVIPIEALKFSAAGLAALDVPTHFHTSAGVAHGIDDKALRLGAAFLQDAFTKLSERH